MIMPWIRQPLGRRRLTFKRKLSAAAAVVFCLASSGSARAEEAMAQVCVPIDEPVSFRVENMSVDHTYMRTGETPVESRFRDPGAPGELKMYGIGLLGSYAHGSDLREVAIRTTQADGTSLHFKITPRDCPGLSGDPFARGCERFDLEGTIELSASLQARATEQRQETQRPARFWRKPRAAELPSDPTCVSGLALRGLRTLASDDQGNYLMQLASISLWLNGAQRPAAVDPRSVADAAAKVTAPEPMAEAPAATQASEATATTEPAAPAVPAPDSALAPAPAESVAL
jgi:hypothetical protein